MIPRVMQSEYMHFAKYGAGARYNLATSGVKDCALADLGVTPDDLALHGVNAGGYGPLIERVAVAAGAASPACATGAALARPGTAATAATTAERVTVTTAAALQGRARRR